MSIYYLRHKDLDLKKWDNCIYRSLNGTVYAFSWFLDVLGNEWGALVEDDYISVMPLIFRKFLGRDIIYTPNIVGELGIFSSIPVTADKTNSFLSSIPREFSCYQVLLNKFNPFESDGMDVKRELRFSLDLIRPYYRISQNYDPAMQNRLHMAVSQQPELTKGISPNDIIGFIKEHGIKTDVLLKRDNYRILRAVMSGLIRTHSGDMYGVYDSAGKLSSVGILSWVNTRLILLFIAFDPGNIILNPHFFLIDRIIDKYSETNSTLNFEFESQQVAPEIYRSFGAAESPVTRVTGGRIPLFMRLSGH